MILDTTSKTIRVVLGEAAVTTQPEYTTAYEDIAVSAGTFVPGATDGSLNGTTFVTVVSSPAGSVQRRVRELSICNVDTNTHIVTVQYYDGSNTEAIVEATIAPTQTLWYGGGAWQVLPTPGPQGPTGMTGPLGTGPTGPTGQAGFLGGTGPTGFTGPTGAASTVTGPTGPASNVAVTVYFTPTGGTYGTPTGTSWLHVRMVGGGGGGAGNDPFNSQPSSNGTTGGNSAFGTAIAYGGGGGANSSIPGLGGSSAGGTLNLNGEPGSPVAASTFDTPGGAGGNSKFGPGGNSAVATNGGNGSFGGGGAGGGQNTLSGSTDPGAGGGAGGYVEWFITSPTGTYSYTVGAGGTGGVGSTISTPTTGGNGGGGLIIIEAHT